MVAVLKGPEGKDAIQSRGDGRRGCPWSRPAVGGIPGSGSGLCSAPFRPCLRGAVREEIHLLEGLFSGRDWAASVARREVWGKGRVGVRQAFVGPRLDLFEKGRRWELRDVTGPLLRGGTRARPQLFICKEIQ